jgi:hypothetical protein
MASPLAQQSLADVSQVVAELWELLIHPKQPRNSFKVGCLNHRINLALNISNPLCFGSSVPIKQVQCDF